ncbi:MAG: winged helix-turn-helix transcriptional regulator [Chloroflexi bacterium]|nr:MAG: hypothetical protein CUN54_07360 [Phototrophicales bacterium]RMF76787.1 MAG: winged helix-turn-helix transcriptional regulator [Chloroflexota bacterium]
MNDKTIEQVYFFIATYDKNYGRSPSMREIARGTFLSLGNVVRYLDKLEMQGLISREPGIARSIRLLDKTPDSR